jgi:hypothetical protein
MLVGNLVAELGVVDLVVVPADALLGHSRGATGFEDVEGLSLELGGHPDLGLLVAQPLVLEVWELRYEVGEGLHLGPRIPAGFFHPTEPERAAGFGTEVPSDDFADVGVEGVLRLLDFGGGRVGAHHVRNARCRDVNGNGRFRAS